MNFMEQNSFRNAHVPSVKSPPQMEFESALQHYLLTPWSEILLEKLIGSQLVKKFPAFYGNWRFITAFTSARYMSLS